MITPRITRAAVHQHTPPHPRTDTPPGLAIAIGATMLLAIAALMLLLALGGAR